MKLVRYALNEKKHPGIIDSNGAIRDLSEVLDDINNETLDDSVIQKLRDLDINSLPLVAKDATLLPCISGVSKFICIGLNYIDHAKEAGREIPTEPVLFMKATSSICGPNDDVWMPPESKKSDWEVELGIVIGKRAKRVTQADAKTHIAGYCLVDDLSEREFQSERGGQWVKGKSLDTYGPIGPWLVTPDEIPDPHALNIWQEIDDIRYQDGNTSDMIFKVDEIVSYVSQFMTLLPGDIIATGTPAGVGLGQKPEKVFLKVGQTIRCGIEGLGEQFHKVTLDPEA